MNLTETGKLIANLRKEAGLTQKELADALSITDKAVSKWERGLCMPDSSLLTKLSMLLDADIEYIVSGVKPYGESDWHGMIDIENVEGEINGKPLLHYLLSYLLLVGITNICFTSHNYSYIRSLNLEQYGIKVLFGEQRTDKTAIIHKPFFIFGVNLTRQFQHCMACPDCMIPTVNGDDIPLIFSHHYNCSIEDNKEKAGRKALGRGTTYIRLNGETDYYEASEFVRISEKYSRQKIADLSEICSLRNIRIEM